jgi:predicted kinase
VPTQVDRLRLFILCGFPFAGKSTFARDLAAKIGAEHVEIDRINTERGFGLDGAAIGASDWDETYKVSFRRVKHHLIAGRSVIHDATNYTRDQREKLRAIADMCSAETIVVCIELPEAEARRRWLANRANGQRHDIRDDDFRNVLDNFEPPGADEGIAIHLDGQQPLATLARQLDRCLDRSVE